VIAVLFMRRLVAATMKRVTFRFDPVRGDPIPRWLRTFGASAEGRVVGLHLSSTLYILGAAIQ
jgi:hypothetical protein